MTISEHNDIRVSIPKQILKSTPNQMNLANILNDYDPDKYEKATTKYRKPVYQRGLKQSVEWCKGLVESIIEQKSIAGFHLSKHLTVIDGEAREHSNIEDGQTRLDAIKRYTNGDFECKYGPYADVTIKMRIDTYMISIILLEKATHDISDKDYFEALQQNFCLLQEGQPLTASDRYAAQYACQEQGFAGSPLVMFTEEIVTGKLSEKFRDYFGIKGSFQRTEETKKKLSDIMGLISATLYGPLYANSKYWLHVPILFTDIHNAKKEYSRKLLNHIFGIIDLAYDEQKKIPREQSMPYFGKTQKFTAAMIADYWAEIPYPNIEKDENNEFIEKFYERWSTCINDVRTHKQNGDNDWIDDKIYKNLLAGQKRNCTEKDIIARMKAVRAYYE